MCIIASGKVYTWGLGATGQLGHGDTKNRLVCITLNTLTISNRSIPTEVEALADKHVKLIACGADHMCCTVIHSWVPDKEAESCMACNREFTFAKRRVSLLCYCADDHVIPTASLSEMWGCILWGMYYKEISFTQSWL